MDVSTFSSLLPIIELVVFLVGIGGVYGVFKDRLENCKDDIESLKEAIIKLQTDKLDIKRHDESNEWLKAALRDITSRINSIQDRLGR